MANALTVMVIELSTSRDPCLRKVKEGRWDQEYNQAMHTDNDRSPDNKKSNSDHDMAEKIKLLQRKKIELCKKKLKHRPKLLSGSSNNGSPEELTGFLTRTLGQ